MIARTGEEHTVWVDGVEIGQHTWAASLRLAPGAESRPEFAYWAGDAAGGRWVRTRRGRFAAPRAFLDTLELDRTGRHFGFVAPDAVHERIEVWIDGVPRVEIDLDELGSAMAAAGDRHLSTELLRRIVRDELARALSGPEAPAR